MYELKPSTQKSFYGKANVFTGKRYDLLQSYSTMVCAIDKKTGAFIRLWGGYSATTQKHVNDFRYEHGVSSIGKKEWESMTVKKADRYINHVMNL